MKILLLAFALNQLLFAEVLPTAEFRALQGSHDTVETIIQAVQKKKANPDKIASTIDGLVNQSRLAQHLMVFGKLKAGEAHRYEKAKGAVGSAGGKGQVPMGSFLEVNPTYFPGQKSAAVSVNYTSREKVGKGEFLKRSFIGLLVISGENWQVVSDWREDAESHLLLVRFTYPAEIEGKSSFNPKAQVKTKVQLLRVTRKDLVRFGKSSSETRQKAIKWLLGRGKVLGDTVVVVPSGQRAAYSKGRNERGWLLSVDAALASNGKDFDLEVEGSWQDQEGPIYQFKVAEEIKGNRAIVISPAKIPEVGDEVVVLVVSPRVVMAKR